MGKNLVSKYILRADIYIKLSRNEKHMKKIVAFTFLLFGIVFAQPDSLLNQGWNPSGVAGLNLSQVAFSNWSQGGENSLAFSLLGNFGAIYFNKPWRIDNNLKLTFGRTKLGDNDYRTTDNEFYLEDVLSYDVGWNLDPYASNTVRTVLANGYQYDADTSYQISAFFDPGYVTQSIGLTYNKSENFKTRFGLAFQETFTNKFNHYSDDPETPNEVEDFKFETGVESVTEAQTSLAENLLAQTKLRLFTRFDALDVWDVYWDNTIVAKINEYVNVNFNVLLIYEKNQSPKTQLKEALQLGLTYNLF